MLCHQMAAAHHAAMKFISNGEMFGKFPLMKSPALV
jgi:hypothetical protein